MQWRSNLITPNNKKYDWSLYVTPACAFFFLIHIYICKVIAKIQAAFHKNSKSNHNKSRNIFIANTKSFFFTVPSARGFATVSSLNPFFTLNTKAFFWELLRKTVQCCNNLKFYTKFSATEFFFLSWIHAKTWKIETVRGMWHNLNNAFPEMLLKRSSDMWMDFPWYIIWFSTSL